ncbi:dol-P-Glc:Glc(2)Man(9)GlcNAc(2)-PP-Dol alpha-1,2-glucosyltransferase-like isoform X2 [Ptychodera flava]
MITTLPGLYLVSIGVLKQVSWYYEADLIDFCSTTMLRLTNVMFAMLNLYLFYAVLKKLNPGQEVPGLKLSITAMTLAAFPVLYFFTFLYYTDAGSTFFVLFMYLLSLYGVHVGAALAGACAIMFRQTNIIWVVFVAGVAAMEMVEQYKEEEEEEERLAKEEQGEDEEEEETETEEPQTPTIGGIIIDSVKDVFNFLTFFPNVLALAGKLLPYGLLAAAFMAFVYKNGGIVVGDRSSHEACLNIPQLFYFFAFTAVFAFPFFIVPFNLLKFVVFQKRHAVFVVASAAVTINLVYFFTYVHPYLIADNRHYPFYVWRKIINKRMITRYALVPLYIFGGWNIANQLSHKTVLWRLVFGACLILATVPQKLLEFRYFIIPYLLFRLNMQLQDYPLIALEMLFYIVINYSTISLFTDNPFTWPDNPDMQRFMW